MCREILSLMWRATGHRLTLRLSHKVFLLLGPLITSACNKHMSTLVLLRLTRDQRVGAIETAVDVGKSDQKGHKHIVCGNTYNTERMQGFFICH